MLDEFGIWQKAVDARLTLLYGLKLEDAGLYDDNMASFFADGDTPEEFVDWFGKKFDLTRVPEGIRR